MSIRIKFDNINNNPLPPTLVLCKRNGAKVKTLDAYKVTLSDSFNAPSEISFELHKSVDGNVNPIWDSIKDFKVIWLKELDTYFEIYVDVEESTETIKKCTGKSICEAELSQINVYNLKVNDENSQSDNPVVLYTTNTRTSYYIIIPNELNIYDEDDTSALYSFTSVACNITGYKVYQYNNQTRIVRGIIIK